MSVGALRQLGHGDATLRRLGARVRRARLEWLAAAVVFVLAAAGLSLAHHSPHLAVPRAAAAAELRANAGIRMALGPVRSVRVEIIPFDARFDRADLYAGSRLIVIALVGRGGVVVGVSDLRRGRAAFGSGIANSPWVLALLVLTFALMTLVWPLRRMHNVDVVLALSFVASVVLYDRNLPVPFMLVTYPALALLALRCGVRALGRPRAVRPATALFDRLTQRMGPDAQLRMLRLGLIAAGLVTAMVGLSSLHVVDVGYAVMEGATLLLHGALPYHHIPDVLHGDTYPLGSYLLYVPFAVLTPVSNVWDDADLTLAVAVAAALLAAWVLGRSGRDAERPPAARTSGLRAAIAWLTFPTVLVTVSSGTTDVVLALALLMAVMLWRRPTAAAGVLALGGWFKLVPLVLAPFAVVRLRGAGWLRAGLAGLAVSTPMLALIIGLGGVHGLREMLTSFGFQQSRVSPWTPWRLSGALPIQQFVEAAVLALVAAGAARLWRQRDLPVSRTRLAALFASVLLGLQLAASYWDVLYLAWIVPLVALMLCGRRDGEPVLGR